MANKKSEKIRGIEGAGGNVEVPAGVPEKIVEDVHSSALTSLEEEAAGLLAESPKSPLNEERALEQYSSDVLEALELFNERRKEVLGTSAGSRSILADEVIRPLV